MIERAIAILQQAGFDLTARELAEIIWLAVHIEESEQSQQQSQQSTVSKPKPPKTNQPRTRTQVTEPRAEVYLPSSVQSSAKSPENREAIPIKVPAAVALRNVLALGRALRPLMRKVPSPTENILDEEATVCRIAQEKIWVPVLKPAPERWLELGLVVEQSSSTAVWKQTITELQRLLKHHGAFRDVRTWELKVTETKVQLFPQNSTGADSSTPYTPEVLIDPKGQRLILLVSDCISPAWRRKFIHPVLELWGRKSLMTILQLLPERLWERTPLASEIPVLLRSLNPGVFNSHLIVETWDKDTTDEIENAIQEDANKIQNSIPVPIVTLEPEPLLKWSQVLAGLGNVKTAGFKFSSVNVVEHRDTQQLTEHKELNLTPQALVSRFRATASPLARRLAGLMAAAPVSLPVVQLIQQTLLSQSSQIHVAEVFMSGLLKPLTSIRQDTDADYIEYEFVEGVRELLLESVPVSKTISVIDNVSEFVAKRLGLSVREFEARLLTPVSQGEDSLKTKIRPFAQLKAQVLRQLGGEYARFAEELEGQYFEVFEFNVVTVNRGGEIIKRETKQAQYFTEDLGNSITLEMVAIPGGKFIMGSPEGEGNDREKPQHEVTVQPFFMGRYPVTQAQWRAVAALPQVNKELDPNPSHFKGDDRPVEQISWYDALEFCARLNFRINFTAGRDYRLPSEAEWEYACRAGTTTPFYFGETITTDLANYRGNSTYGNAPTGEYRQQTIPVGSFPPNAFGLYDMHGNVSEWCADTWHENYQGAPKDGSAWINDNDNRTLLRGGSWDFLPVSCRSASRGCGHRAERDNIVNYIGFRVVCVFGRS
ncbi:SAV_2336 N-terminal domain-related protein [Scytonema sp. PCC 10023]|uniref:SAV_2336 N-terminal domain-related protein n=1 Tax=Scytonema sp. PCC 10023 TaxID=1680591 RepID=UPI0039C759CB